MIGVTVLSLRNRIDSEACLLGMHGNPLADDRSQPDVKGTLITLIQASILFQQPDALLYVGMCVKEMSEEAG